MEVTVRNQGNDAIVEVSGRLDAVTASELEGGVADVLTGTEGRVVLNLRDLEYISSAGLRVILVMVKRLKAKQKDLAVAALQGAVKKVFEVSGFISFVKIYDTEEDALR